MVNQVIKIGVMVAVLLLLQGSFGLVQENLLVVFPFLTGIVGLVIGILGLILAAFLLVKHIIPKFI